MKIRKAAQKDVKVLAKLRYLLHEYEKKIDKTDTIERCNDEIKNLKSDVNNKNISFFIAYDNKRSFGYSKLKIKEINGEIMGHIGAIFVLEEFRKKGIGKELINFMTKYLIKRKINKISLEVYKRNNLAIKVYEKLGFKITTPDKNSLAPKNSVFRMEKEI